MHDPGRRRFLTAAAALGAAGLLPRRLESRGPAPGHPRLFLTARKTGALRSLDEVRASIREGRSRALWTRLLDAARAELDAPPVTPATPVPGRTPGAVARRNPDYPVTHAAGQRALRHALVHLLTGEPRHRTAALRQIEALLDPEAWPRWMDQAHEHYGHPADLRTGMLAADLGLAYDWLHPSLAAPERRRIEEGLDERAVRPFLASLALEPWWVRELNNWTTVIAGGVSVAALALGEACPRSGEVLRAARPLMDAYLSRYGPEGEFNESPAYANATDAPVLFYEALRYASGGGENRLAHAPFPQACYWTMYLTLPPGRIAALGDSRPDARPRVRHVAAVAAAARDGILQEFYLRTADPSAADPLELLWHDAGLAPLEPHGRLPLGRLFPAHGGCFASRSGWEPEAPACIVYGKVGREENHEHNDDGQICVDGRGERLIVDLGPPAGGYPADYFEEPRWRYYNASVRGHNVLAIGGRERRYPRRTRGDEPDERERALRGRLLGAAFDDARGGWWRAELTALYEGARRVRRTMVHLLPGVVAVLDEAELERPEEISLRWHTIGRSAPDAEGGFLVRGRQAVLAARVVGLEGGPVAFRRGEHGYAPPFDHNRDGDPLPQPRESYVEAVAHAARARFLTLFAVAGADEPRPVWRPEGAGFAAATPAGAVRVTASPAELRVEEEAGGRAWRVALDAGR